MNSRFTSNGVILLFAMYGLMACVPLNQQNIYEPTGEELPIIVDEALYNETRYVIDNNVNEISQGNVLWDGSCVENPIFSKRFQSHYTENKSVKVSNDILLLNISYGGGCGCSQKQLI